MVDRKINFQIRRARSGAAVLHWHMLIYPRFQPGQVPLQRMPLERFGRVKGLARGVAKAQLHNLTEAEVERPFPNQDGRFPKAC